MCNGASVVATVSSTILLSVEAKREPDISVQSSPSVFYPKICNTVLAITIGG